MLGAAALTRPDALVFTVLLVGALVIVVAGARRVRLERAGVAAVAFAIVVMPWVVRNATEVGEATIATTSSTTALAGANCDTTYYGDRIGLWDFGCVFDERHASEKEAVWSAELRRDAIDYAADHVERIPLVGGARLARSVGLWGPRAQAEFEAEETRAYRWQLLALATSLVVLVVGGYGIARYSPDARTRWLLAVPVITGFVVVLAAYANSRFRIVGVPALAVGVALAVSHPGIRGRAPSPASNLRHSTTRHVGE